MAKGFHYAERTTANLECTKTNHSNLHQAGHFSSEIAEVKPAHERRNKFLCHLCTGFGDASDVHSLKVDFFAFECCKHAGHNAVEQFARAFAELRDGTKHDFLTAAIPPVIERFCDDFIPRNKELIGESIRILKISAVEHARKKFFELLRFGDAAVDKLLNLLLNGGDFRR